MSEQPGRHSDQFNLRLPDGMRDRLKAEADANKRSMNAEIVARLQGSLDPSTMPVSVQDFMHKYIETYLVMQTDEMMYYVLDSFDKMGISNEQRAKILANAPPRMQRTAAEREAQQKQIDEVKSELDTIRSARRT